jgi:predicted glycoside hydrolase/deacetylase ChbG (UPF0249 family)
MAAGVVTSVSLLANGPALGHAVKRIRDRGGGRFSCGLHLNLSEGRPLAEGLRLLTGPDGCFLGKARAHRLLARSGDAPLEEEIARETAAQMTRLLEAGVEIRHLDGHQHVHVFPAAVCPVMTAAKGQGIPWIRVPWEPTPSGGEACPDDLRDEGMRFSRLAWAARGLFRDAPLRTTDAVRGLYLKGEMTLERLEATLEALPAGLTELMVHPGMAHTTGPGGPFSSFSTGEREGELHTLLHPRFLAILDRLEMSLSPFPEKDP